VTKNVLPYSIVGGVPARLIRNRFEPEVIERLLAVAWWQFPVSVFEDGAANWNTTDPASFLAWAEGVRKAIGLCAS
jgi:hypothetical protein